MPSAEERAGESLGPRRGVGQVGVGAGPGQGRAAARRQLARRELRSPPRWGSACPLGLLVQVAVGLRVEAACSVHQPWRLSAAADSPALRLPSGHGHCHPHVTPPAAAGAAAGQVRGRVWMPEDQGVDRRRRSAQAPSPGSPGFSHAPVETPHLERAVCCVLRFGGRCSGVARPELGRTPPRGTPSWQCLQSGSGCEPSRAGVGFLPPPPRTYLWTPPPAARRSGNKAGLGSAVLGAAPGNPKWAPCAETPRAFQRPRTRGQVLPGPPF